MTQVYFKNWQPDTEPLPPVTENGILLIKHMGIVTCLQEYKGRWGIFQSGEWYYFQELEKPYEWLDVRETDTI